MSVSLHSAYWYRVADRKPRLRQHVQVNRHVYRGQPWYVLQDPLTGRQHRFNRNAFFLIHLMDGQRRMQEIWDLALEQLGDEAPTQDETIGLLFRLDQGNLLDLDTVPDSESLQEQARLQRQQDRKQRFAGPFYLRFPLVDPQPWLEKLLPLARFLTWKWLPLLWILVVFPATLMAGAHWQELTHDLGSRLLNQHNIFLLWLCYPAVKLIHELAHALTIVAWGGQVHEGGIILLFFTPVPYVDGSSAVSFPEKTKRMAVAAAGMAAELFLAALALLLWLHIGPGLLRTLAFNVMIIGSVSTLLVNGNPLLRFDGYYLMSDFLEIPNLATRSRAYLLYLIRRYLLGQERAVSPQTAAGEPCWFILYGLGSLIYRVAITLVLALVIASRYFFLGVVLAIWGIFGQLLLPLIRTLGQLGTENAGSRRPLLVSSALAALAALFLFAVPFPLRTQTQGTIWLPEQSRIRAGTDCVVTRVLRPDHSQVMAAEPVLQCEDPFLRAETEVVAARLQELQASYGSLPLSARVDRGILRDRIGATRAALAQKQERLHKLTIRAPADGLLILPQDRNLPGHFLHQGDVSGYVLGHGQAAVLAVIPNDRIGLFRDHVPSVQIRLADRPEHPLASQVLRQVPAATRRLPSPMLAAGAGGPTATDPTDPQETTALERIFLVELSLPLPKDQIRINQRVHVLFDHGHQPLAWQWWHLVRQLLLSRFHV